MLTLWQFFEKIFQSSNQQKFSKKQQKQKQKRKSKKWQKLKQVNTLFETITSIPPSTTLFCYKKTTTTERMPLCDLDPPFFAKNNKKKERNFTGFVVYRRILLQKKTYNESKTTYYDVLVG